jgi:hypothetical protein
MGWQESPQPAGMFMKKDKAQDLLDPGAHCYRREIKGNHKNEDILV